MFKFLPYLVRTLWRHRTRSLLTVSGSSVALFVFTFILAVKSGLDQLTSQGDSTLIVFQANKFCPATSHLPQDYALAIRQIPGVVDVAPIQVFTNNCRASLDVIVFYGMPAEQVRRVRDFTLIAGDWAEFERRQDGAIVGEALAQRRKVGVGQSFSVGDVTVRVVGIFRSQNRAEEDYVYCHLDFLQRTRGLDLVGTVTQHEVLLADGASAAEVAAAIDRRYAGGPVQTDTRTKGVFQASSLEDLIQLIELSEYLGLACLALMAALLATTTIMTVEDRIQEHAVLQTIGFSTWRVFRLVLAECVLLSLLGGIIGVGTAWGVLSASALSLGAEAVTIAFIVTPAIVAWGVATAAVVGAASGLLPAWHASRADIVSALRGAPM
jgi:putative ABC transport system permease protein